MAAVSLTNPIFILLMAFAICLVWAEAQWHLWHGRGKAAESKKYYGFYYICQPDCRCWGSSAFIGVYVAILKIFGANGETYEYAKGYVQYIAWGAPFIIWSAAASFVVRSEGASKEAMIGSMVGTIANIVLDPLFITGLHMGAAGAAIATTIGNILASLYFVWYFLKKSRQLSILPKDFTLREQISGRVCAIGLPTAIFSAFMSVSTIVINQILVKYGNAPVAAIGIVFKANMFITFLQMGLANGVQPLLGYSYGAGNVSRFREVERFTKICCLVTGIAATLLYFIGREPIIRMFISEDEVVYYGVKMLVAYMISGPVIGILFVNMNCMQSVNHSLPATILSVMRQGILLIPLLYVLQFFWGMEGVIYGQSITDYIAVFLSAVLWRNIRKKL